MTILQYNVVLQRTENGYCAYSPDVPGCIAADDSFEDTLQLMAEAIEFHLEGMLEHGESIPEPKSLRYYLDSGGWELTPDDVITQVSVNVSEFA
ncbi:MAG: type II toxin-antitoxin system HicB family antitoxin [Candidatus Kapabacteria bacterium]|jgi:predicted RNase H-like HicB family nuclease|nr:type II toxin-antitoxin system HicB family antitoxin [Candidatus Kapabacteria bacterium]